jgi:erythromycin esterase-like protein
MGRRTSTEPAVGPALLDEVRSLCRPLHTPADLDPLMARIGDTRMVLLGEASHGTSEFYTWRTAITRRLVTERGFNFVAVEGDWPDCHRVNRFVKGYRVRPTRPSRRYAPSAGGRRGCGPTARSRS